MWVEYQDFHIITQHLQIKVSCTYKARGPKSLVGNKWPGFYSRNTVPILTLTNKKTYHITWYIITLCIHQAYTHPCLFVSATVRLSVTPFVVCLSIFLCGFINLSLFLSLHVCTFVYCNYSFFPLSLASFFHHSFHISFNLPDPLSIYNNSLC